MESLIDFTSEEILDFNEGRRPIWTALDPLATTFLQNEQQTKSILTSAQSKISWLCGPGSPCNNIVPDFPESPSYFLRIQISTRQAQLDTYCSYEMDFLIRLHGLQMSYTSTVLQSLVTMVGIGGVLVVIFVLFFRKNDDHLRQVLLEKERKKAEQGD